MAVILKDTNVEYKDYSWQEIRKFIEYRTGFDTLEKKQFFEYNEIVMRARI